MRSIKKDFISEISFDEITKDDLDLINKFTRREMQSEELYVFNVTLCDNEIDRDFERFSIDSLHKLAELYIGKTGVFDHSMKGKDQTARIFFTQVKTDISKKTKAGEVYTYLTAKAYMPRTEKNKDLIEEIDAGIKKEVSVNCAVSQTICSVCGTDTKQKRCEHIRGKSHGKEVCHLILEDPTDAYEWSFVAVPAQPAAGITKSFSKENQGGICEMKDLFDVLKSVEKSVTLSKKEADMITEYIEKLEKLAEDGKSYKNALLSEVVRLSLITVNDINEKSFRSVCEKASVAELCELKKAFEKKAQEKMPLASQLSKNNKNNNNTNNSDFKI